MPLSFVMVSMLVNIQQVIVLKYTEIQYCIALFIVDMNNRSFISIIHCNHRKCYVCILYVYTYEYVFVQKVTIT